LKYDDNEIEWLDLSKNKFKVLNVTDRDNGRQSEPFPGCPKFDSSIHRKSSKLLETTSNGSSGNKSTQIPSESNKKKGRMIFRKLPTMQGSC
jgi:hypothetical protein